MVIVTMLWLVTDLIIRAIVPICIHVVKLQIWVIVQWWYPYGQVQMFQIVRPMLIFANDLQK